LIAQPATLESVPVERDVDDINSDASNTKDDAGDTGKSEGKSKEPKYVIPSKYRPPLPFPERVVQAKLDKQFSKFLELLKTLKIKMSFTDVLTQMPLMLSS
jgi:hypothetical protein